MQTLTVLAPPVGDSRMRQVRRRVTKSCPQDEPACCRITVLFDDYAFTVEREFTNGHVELTFADQCEVDRLSALANRLIDQGWVCRPARSTLTDIANGWTVRAYQREQP